jgi:hypothetical protein
MMLDDIGVLGVNDHPRIVGPCEDVDQDSAPSRQHLTVVRCVAYQRPAAPCDHDVLAD